MRKFYIVLVMLAFATANDAIAKKRKVLFVGNSYIYSNNMPQMLEQLCTAMGDTLMHSSSTPGGQTLEGHSTDPTTQNLIASDNWDIVIIQEQSQRPAFPQSQVATDTYPYATSLYNDVKANNSCSEVMFLMTWGRKNGDASNCVFHPPICTYLGMQGELRYSYIKMAQDNNSSVAPVGAAWKVVRDSFPTLELYVPDESHPNVAGSYLEACVLYASMFHKSPVGTSYLGGVAAADAAKLQRIAAMVTLDSLETWQQHGNLALAKMSVTNVGPATVSFTNTSMRVNSYTWDFGDGTNAMAITPPDKTYTFAQLKYLVTLVASNSCNKDSYVDTAYVFPVGVADVAAGGKVYIYRDGAGRNILHLGDNADAITKLEIFDMAGRKVWSKAVNGESLILIDVVPGSYIFSLMDKNNAIKVKGRLVQQ